MLSDLDLPILIPRKELMRLRDPLNLANVLRIAMFAFFLISCPESEKKDILSIQERTWLSAHDGKIIIDRTNETWAPIEDSDNYGNPVGIAIDYYKLIEKKLGFRFKVDEARTWEERLRRYKSREIDVVNNLQKTSARSEYLLFTEPYIEIPNVIIVRKEIDAPLTLDKMTNMKIAVTNGYAIHEYLKNNYDYLNIAPKHNDVDALQDVALNRVDAVVINFAVASYLIEKEGISNLRIAGAVGYNNALCIASRKDWPILNRILQKGLASITPEEKKAIYKKWIHLELKPFYKNRIFQAIIATSILIIVISLFWNIRLRKEIDERKRIQEEREKLIRELQEAAGRIKTLSGLVPICAECKRIRDDKGYWSQLETYIQNHTDALFTHGICSECEKKLYGEHEWYKKRKKKE